MNIQEIKQQIEEAQSLRLLTRVFTEISSSKLKRIRKGIEQNRAFFYDLTNIYSLINMLAVKQGIKRQPKNSRTAVILLTSNYRFYGQVTNPLMTFFLKKNKKTNEDYFIVGKTAHAYLDSIHYQTPYKKMIFNSDIPNISEIQNLTGQVKDYAKVVVIYSQMKSVLIQQPMQKDITQSIDPLLYTNQTESVKKLLSEFDYILEPDLDIMVQFFDTQIKGLLLEHTFLESELARTAARLISMDSAQNEAKKYLENIKNELAVERKNITNARIIETVAALKLIRSKHGSG